MAARVSAEADHARPGRGVHGAAIGVGAERLARAITIDLSQGDKAIHRQRLADVAERTVRRRESRPRRLVSAIDMEPGHETGNVPGVRSLAAQHPRSMDTAGQVAFN